MAKMPSASASMRLVVSAKCDLPERFSGITNPLSLPYIASQNGNAKIMA
jgi:hypothetical protein